MDCSNMEVEDPHRVLEEQGKRVEITYRPVIDNEIRQVVDRRYSSLWNFAAKRLSRQLHEYFGWTKAGLK